MTDEQINTQAIAGDISLKLENGTEEEKQSLGRLFKYLRPDDYKEILDSYGIILNED